MTRENRAYFFEYFAFFGTIRRLSGCLDDRTFLSDEKEGTTHVDWHPRDYPSGSRDLGNPLNIKISCFGNGKSPLDSLRLIVPCNRIDRLVPDWTKGKRLEPILTYIYRR